ncbi:MAG: NFYB/HAP3 family transcription factor subunit [Candidatus Aenigmarchaeota archaeon]|nr:NFYB/HAP3 family transcription factor subunit [Candidatus Aenigmarchaeota archaeon]
MSFNLQPLRKVFKRAGAKRVSDAAALELGKVLENRSSELLIEAQKLALHANRRTVMRKDIKMARKNAKK